MAANAGFRSFVAGAVLTAAQVNDYLMSQAVMTFASVAARAAAITSPAKGMWSFTSDTNTLWYYDGATWFPPLPKVYRKTADQTVSASTVLVDDVHLQFAVAANEVWTFDAFLQGNGQNTGDLKATFVGPAASTIVYGVIGGGQAAAMGTTTDATEINLTAGLAGAATVILGTATGASTSTLLRGVITNGANAGTFKLQWAQNAASGSMLVLTGSYMTVQRVL